MRQCHHHCFLGPQKCLTRAAACNDGGEVGRGEEGGGGGGGDVWLTGGNNGEVGRGGEKEGRKEEKNEGGRGRSPLS